MAPEARITPAPSPSLTTNADPEADSSVPPPHRMTPTETTASDQGIRQQHQQTLSNPNALGRRPPRSLINQRKMPLTPLGYELTPSPRRCSNLSSRTPSMLQPNLPDPAPKKAFNPTVEPSLDSENRATPAEE
jgi:hypothetical protein